MRQSLILHMYTYLLFFLIQSYYEEGTGVFQLMIYLLVTNALIGLTLINSRGSNLFQSYIIWRSNNSLMSSVMERGQQPY